MTGGRVDSDASGREWSVEERLRLLSEAMRDFAEATAGPQQVLDGVARRVATVVKGACVVLLVSDDGRRLVPGAVHCEDVRALGRMRRMFATDSMILDEHPSMRRVLETGEAFFVPRLSHEQLRALAPSYDEGCWEDSPVRGVLVVALRVGGRSIGTLSLARFGRNTPPFAEVDRDFAQSLAAHAALAIENSRWEVLRESEKAHRLLFDVSPVPMLVVEVSTLEVLAANVVARDGAGRARLLNQPAPAERRAQ